MSAQRRNDKPFGLKTPKKEKLVKRNKNQPPVEAPYVPPKPQKITKSLLDKTVEIFEGMTIVELAKRTGEPISALQTILVNVGEKVDSEFEPLSIDVAELVSMVKPFITLHYPLIHVNQNAYINTNDWSYFVQIYFIENMLWQRIVLL